MFIISIIVILITISTSVDWTWEFEFKRLPIYAYSVKVYKRGHLLKNGMTFFSWNNKVRYHEWGTGAI